MRLALILVLVSSSAGASPLECIVTKKVGASEDYTTEQLARETPTVVIDDPTPAGVVRVSRCGYSSVADRITCDKYTVDRVEEAIRGNLKNYGAPEKIIKYYLFKAHFDVQLFPDGTFIENNGRGLISFGSCRPLSSRP